MAINKDTQEDIDQGEIIKTFCQVCQNTHNRRVNHEILKSLKYNVSEEAPGYFYAEYHCYQIIQCRACEEITFRHISGNSEDIIYEDDGSNHELVTERLYPKRSASSLKDKIFWNTPQKLKRIYQETIEAFNSKSFTLCAAGLRAIVEGICADQSIQGKNLQEKIDGLSEKGLLTKTNANILHEHRFLGNSAVHELEQPTAYNLKLAIEIIEHILETLFEMPHKGEALKQHRGTAPKLPF